MFIHSSLSGTFSLGSGSSNGQFSRNFTALRSQAIAASTTSAIQVQHQHQGAVNKHESTSMNSVEPSIYVYMYINGIIICIYWVLLSCMAGLMSVDVLLNMSK